MQTIQKLLWAVLLAGGSAVALAQPYPSKPIRIIVAYTPAGTTDILARAIGQKMSEAWGQPVIVDNRPGANGNIGTEIAARATPDGYSILMGTAATHSINNTLYPKLTWGAVKDFAPIGLVALVPNLLVVNNALPVKSVKELVAYAKANPGKLTHGSPGNGSTAHLSMELFKSLTATQMIHVPYKGSAAILADVMGGQISLTMDNIPVYLPHAKSGKIRALAVSSGKRTPAAPELPTVAEAGVPGLEAVSWFGLVAPARTPQAIVDKLSAETARILKSPDVNKRITDLGAEPVGGTPQEYAAFIQSEIKKWRKVIQDAGVRLD
ncbi:MAG: tripartite tricarboxylate transporter substrate binding protein [Betaproteobacteria bacterium]|nr:tripartite tricarboxylate transporter substrate binding protein [Betaproteobacteria bacterium]